MLYLFYYMIKALVSDFSRVLLLPIDAKHVGGLNALHKKLSAQGNYDFWTNFRLNDALLAFYKTLSARIDIYIFTAEYIQEYPALEPKLKGVFKNIFSAARLGVKKDDPQAYKAITTKIGLKPKEILYMDDSQTNCNAAKQAGMAVIHYQSNDQAKNEISEIIVSTVI